MALPAMYWKSSKKWNGIADLAASHRSVCLALACHVMNNLLFPAQCRGWGVVFVFINEACLKITVIFLALPTSAAARCAMCANCKCDCLYFYPEHRE